jgi:hydroxyacylglutathione hydrolase
MILKRFYEEQLAQASYLVGCQATGEAAVIDPNRDLEVYLQAVADQGLRLTVVTETHIHADFVSGARELARRSGAQLCLSGLGAPDWAYRFAEAEGARLLGDGDVLEVGKVRLQALHTPGHTPEHLSFLLTDVPASPHPMGAFTGDFLFVGDVGRPDLLERAAGVRGTARPSAASLFRSLQRFRQLPDYLQIWPAHGAGSACGKGLGAVPQSTLGYEKLANWAFSIDDEAAFVDRVLAGQPEPPTYFAEMKRVNRDGPPLLGHRSPPPVGDPADLPALLEARALVIDLRPAEAYATRHLPGTLSIPYGRSFLTWAGWLLPCRSPFYLLGEPAVLEGAWRKLTLIGHEDVSGCFDLSALEGGPLASQAWLSPEEAARLMGQSRIHLLDVRSQAEWEAEHIPGAQHVPLGHLPGRLAEVDRDRPLVVHCQSGARSAIAVSLLEREGRGQATNMRGGLAAWKAAGLPVETAAAATA